MYCPAFNQETDVSVLRALIAAHPFGVWVVARDNAIVANHIPFLLDPDRGEHGTLVGHVARANPVWRELAAAADSLVIFQGPQGYVTPSWYAAKREHGKVVPTWNYAVVHAHGRARAIEDRGWLLQLVNRLTDGHEAARDQPWQVGDAPADYIESMLGAIVGVEIPLSKLEGKWKVSQNRSDADKLGVVAGLIENGDAESAAMAALVQCQVAPRGS